MAKIDLFYAEGLTWRELFKLIGKVTELKSPNKKEKISRTELATYIRKEGTDG